VLSYDALADGVAADDLIERVVATVAQVGDTPLREAA
jgi:hypothetical protein